MMIKQLNSNQIRDLKDICRDNVFENVSMAEISRWKIGGIAQCIVRPRSTIEISKLIKYLRSLEYPYIVIGSTTNLLFTDERVCPIIIQLGEMISDYSLNGNILKVQAGKWVPEIARYVARAGYSGIEHTVGIPGTIGGLICMNGGSQRRGIGTHIKSVTAVSPDGNVKIFNNEECKFSYRTSIFQENQYVVSEAELEFTEIKDYNSIRDEMLNILKSRRAKFPQKFPNCGSTFISNPSMYEKFGPPGRLIEDLGFKGYRIGGAQVSEVHANFINNIGGAKASDVLALIKLIVNTAYNYTGMNLEAEVKYIDSSGVIKQAHLV